jgi:hypothetical protein
MERGWEVSNKKLQPQKQGDVNAGRPGDWAKDNCLTHIGSLKEATIIE